MLDAVLLEWEGVLADTGRLRRDEFLRTLAGAGVHWTAEAYDALSGELDTHAMAVSALASVGRIDPTLAELVARQVGRRYAEVLSQGFTLQRDVARFTSALAPHVRLAVVTRAGRVETDVALTASGLIGSVAVVVTADEVTEVPPSPEIYAKAISCLSRTRRVGAASCVALVESAAAVRAARAAGVRTLAVGAPSHVRVQADGAADAVTALTYGGIVELLREFPAVRA